MRWTRWTAVLMLLSALTPAIFSLACAPQASAPPPAPAPDPIARGKYLTVVMSCVDCHTPGTFYGAPDTMRTLSGSDIGWVGPWGVVHARNLTPDSTGIGAWTTEDIVKALRTGNTPDGRQLAPIMPWMNYTNLTEEDANAIAAYLKSLPPVHHVNLPMMPPGKKPTGSNFVVPPPPAWDVPRAAETPPAK